MSLNRRTRAVWVAFALVAVVAALAKGTWRLHLLGVSLSLLPPRFFAAYRARLYRLAGFKGVSNDGVYIEGALRIRGEGNIYQHLRLGPRVTLGHRCHIELDASVDIEPGAVLCHHVAIMTGSHEVGGVDRRSGAPLAKTVRIGAGAWVGAYSVICPGVTIGRGAVVNPGSVVVHDVPDNVVVQGAPARVIARLEEGNGEGGSSHSCSIAVSEVRGTSRA
jgi:maltose O-acetyltransferase